MQSYQSKAPSEKSQKSPATVPVLIGGGAFLVGAVMAFGYAQWNAQKQQLALMTQMVEQMGQQPVTQLPAVAQIAPVADTVTRTEQADLLSVSAAAAATPQAPVVEAVPEVIAAPETTAEKLRKLVAASAAQEEEVPILGNLANIGSSSDLDDEAIKGAQRLETLAIIHAGVQELVAAVVAGEYDIHTDYEDENFSGRIHFSFVGHEKDQTALERFLADAAESGVIAHSNSVVDGDGSVNGHILLFELVERALENGTLEQQAAGRKLRNEAVAMLAKDSVVGEAVENAAGQRFYTVEAGDSLAYIALQFYGNTNAYELIFQANRNTLRTPDKIRVGQKLLIPSA